MKKIFVVNPGSTSTKIALFHDAACMFATNIPHTAEKLSQFKQVSDQLPYRMDAITATLEEQGLSLDGIDAFVGRGGGLYSMGSGVYRVNKIMLDQARNMVRGITHPAILGSQLAAALQIRYGGACYTVNPPSVDEFSDLARMTGVKGIYRNSHLHALNLKETAIHHAKAHGLNYRERNFVVCHLGGGISVSAHRHGEMVDGNDNIGGDGPMAPTRCGQVPATQLIDLIEAKGIQTARDLCTKTGGFISHLNTADAREVEASIKAGGKAAERVWNAMLYQIGKEIGAMAVVLEGEVDGILLSGGLVHSQSLVDAITQSCSWIAPVYSYPGEFELEAMANGALRALNGEEEIKEYTGKPVWSGFEEDDT